MKTRARIDADQRVPASTRMAEFALPAAGLALTVMVVLTLAFPPQGIDSGPESMTQAIGTLPADVLADALVDQAERAGISDGSLLDVVTDERFDREIVKTLISDPSALGELDGSCGGGCRLRCSG